MNKSQEGDSLTFGKGLLMSSNFFRPPDNRTDFLKDLKLSAVHQKFSDRKENLGETEISDSPVQGFSVCIQCISKW